MQADETKREREVLSKLDKQGQFSLFPGVTVVAQVSPEDQVFWSRVYAVLSESKHIRDNFSLLPPDSYHLTTLNLYTEQDFGSQQWPLFLNQHLIFFQHLHQLLSQTYDFTPTIRFKTIISDGVLQLEVALPKDQVSKIDGIANQLKMQKGVPRFFHITLAYQNKSISQSTELAIASYLKETLSWLIDSNVEKVLQAPRLCSFNDMTKFTPWNGKQIPFQNRNNTAVANHSSSHFAMFTPQQNCHAKKIKKSSDSHQDDRSNKL